MYYNSKFSFNAFAKQKQKKQKKPQKNKTKKKHNKMDPLSRSCLSTNLLNRFHQQNLRSKDQN